MTCFFFQPSGNVVNGVHWKVIEIASKRFILLKSSFNSFVFKRTKTIGKMVFIESVRGALMLNVQRSFVISVRKLHLFRLSSVRFHCPFIDDCSCKSEKLLSVNKVLISAVLRSFKWSHKTARSEWEGQRNVIQAHYMDHDSEI